MRRRWEWPILGVIRDMEAEERLLTWVLWLFGGFVLLGIPALAIGTDKNNDTVIHAGSLAFWMLVGWVAPLVVPVLIFGGFLAVVLGRLLIPRRVTEPVYVDLRELTRPRR